MPYTPFYGTGWVDEPTETTPIVAAALNHAEAGITAAAATADAASAALPGKVDRAGDAMTGRLAPHVVALTDAATITVDATLGNDFRVTLGGNRTMAAPSSPADGQVIVFGISQDATGSRTVTWTGGAGGYSFGSGSAPVLSTAASALDWVSFRYHLGKNSWCCQGSGDGF